MRQTAGFSKYAVAFSDNNNDLVGGIEGPEELVQFLVKNKQKKSHPQKSSNIPSSSSTVKTPSNIKPKPSSKPERKYNEGEQGGRPRQRRSNKPASPEQPKTNVDSPNHEMSYEHHKGSRPVHSRGRDRNNNNRGAHQLRNAEIFDAKHRVYDRHSGMAKTSVKPSPRTHGRDDFDIKNTLENEINIDSTGHVNVNMESFEDGVEVPAGNVAVQQDDKPSRPSRGGPRQSRGGNGGGRDRFNNSRRGNNSGEFRSSKPRGGRNQQPSGANQANNVSAQAAPVQSGYMLNDKDFPSFDA